MTGSKESSFSARSDAWIIRAAAITTIALFASLALQILSDRQTKPDLSIATHQWKAYFPQEATQTLCLSAATNESRCPASSSFGPLWESSIRRTDSTYEQSAKEVSDRPYWIGLSVPPETLQKARELRAPVFMVGTLFGEYEVWLDGHLFSRGSYTNQDLPIYLQLSEERLSQPRDLKVAIQIKNNEGMGTADDPTFSLTSGFYSSLNSDRVLRWTLFYGYTRHLIAFSLFFMLGLIFFSTAFFQSRGYEYFAAGQLAFVLALISSLSVDTSARVVGISGFYFLLTFLVLCESALVIKFSLGLSRLQRRITSWLIPGAAVFFGLLLGLRNETVLEGVDVEWMLRFLTPSCLLLAAGICAYPIWLHQKRNILLPPKRLESLAVASFFFMITGLLFFRETTISPGIDIHWSRFLHIFHLGYWSTFLARDYRQSRRLAETLPVSRFHRHSVLPLKLEGHLLAIDLKSSERWYRKGAEMDLGGSFIHLVISQVWQSLDKKNATVLETEGDSIMIWFDNSDHGLPQVVETIFEIKELLESLTSRMRDTTPELAGLPPFRFRGSLVAGAIRPIWREVGRQKVPSWVEAGSQNAFVNCARLLDFERQHDADRSQVVMPEELVENLQANSSLVWVTKSEEFQSKSGGTHRVGLLAIEDAPTLKKIA